MVENEDGGNLEGLAMAPEGIRKNEVNFLEVGFDCWGWGVDKGCSGWERHVAGGGVSH
jgi:hypothetical protein